MTRIHYRPDIHRRCEYGVNREYLVKDAA